MQHIYHRAKFECSSFSSLANTRDKKARVNRVKYPVCFLILILSGLVLLSSMRTI